MPRYVVRWDYATPRYEMAAGEEIELPEEIAAHINRDSPGVLLPVETPAPEPGGRDVARPPADRMQRPARRRDAGARLAGSVPEEDEPR